MVRPVRRRVCQKKVAEVVKIISNALDLATAMDSVAMLLVIVVKLATYLMECAKNVDPAQIIFRRVNVFRALPLYM